MTSIGSPSPFFLAGKKAYEVERSLRFNSGDSPELTRTPSGAGNRKTWTLSFWAKISNDDLGSHGFLFSTGADSSNKVQINLESSNRLTFEAKSGGSTQAYIRPSNNLRDISAWYHFVIRVDTTDSTSTNRIKIYINGTQQTDLALNTFPSEDAEFEWNKAQEHNIGKRTYSSNYFNGYLAEINFIDGQAYDSSYFGETDSITGQWNPIKYVGSYGTNGFYLNFSDNSGTTATTLGKDNSGNGNNFTPNNFAVSDAVKDSPTNNFATMSPLAVSGDGNHPTFTEGNLKTMGPNSGIGKVGATFGLSSGKWYVEAKITQGGSNLQLGIIFSGTNYANNEYLGSGSDYAIAADTYNKKIRKEGSDNQTSLGGMQNGDILAFAIDMDNGTFQLYNNGSTKGSQVSFTVANYAPVTFAQTTGYDTVGTHWNFGADSSFAGAETAQGNADANGQGDFYYSPPSGFLAVCSANLPDPTILLPNKHVDTVIYSGDGNSTKTLSNVLEFQPDWLWLKVRNAAYAHLLYDAVRGAGSLKAVSSSTAGTEGSPADNSTYGFLSSFDANGFTVTNGTAGTTFTNQSSKNYVTWNWNAGDTDGKTYTVKVHDFSGNNRYIFDDFQTQAVTLDLAEGGTYIFNMDDASNASHPFSIGTAANGTVYTSGITYFLDGVSKTYSEYTSGFAAATTRRLHITVPASAPVLYYWCSVHSGMGGQINTNSTLGSSNFDGSLQATVKANTTAGFSIGTYTAQSSGSATVGHGLAIAPDVVITKSRTVTSNWYIYHKDIGQNGWILFTSGAATTSNSAVWNPAPTSSVFTYGSGLVNQGNIVFYAFSEVPGYSKFGKYEGNGSSEGPFAFTGFKPALVIIKGSDNADHWYIIDNERDTSNVCDTLLRPNLGNNTIGTEFTFTTLDFLSNGFKIRSSDNAFNGNNLTYIYLCFAESPFKYARAR